MAIPTPPIHRRDLLSPVRQLLRRKNVCISSWSVEPIAYAASHPASGGLFRVTGSADEDGHPVPWSLVLKLVVAPDVSSARIGEWSTLFLSKEGNDPPPSFWAREALAYRDGVLSEVLSHRVGEFRRLK